MVGAPEDFISTSQDKVTGHVIDINRLEDVPSFGKGTYSNGEVIFDKDDVYVYDKNGTVFYAKGYVKDGEVFYNATVHTTK